MARDFTGTPNDLSTPDSTAWSPAGDFSVSAWVRRDSNTEGAAVAKWNGTGSRSFILYIDTTPKVNIAILMSQLPSSGFAASKTGFTDNVWHQIGFKYVFAASHGGARLSAVLDGVRGTETNASFAINDGNLATRIGSSSDDSTDRYWDGAICDVAAWSVALSDDEWAVLAKGVPANRVRPGSLVAYVPLWGAGTGEPDLSGNANHFTVNGTLNPRDHGPVGAYVLAA